MLRLLHHSSGSPVLPPLKKRLPLTLAAALGLLGGALRADGDFHRFDVEYDTEHQTEITYSGTRDALLFTNYWKLGEDDLSEPPAQFIARAASYLPPTTAGKAHPPALRSLIWLPQHTAPHGRIIAASFDAVAKSKYGAHSTGPAPESVVYLLPDGSPVHAEARPMNAQELQAHGVGGAPPAAPILAGYLYEAAGPYLPHLTPEQMASASPAGDKRYLFSVLRNLEKQTVETYTARLRDILHTQDWSPEQSPPYFSSVNLITLARSRVPLEPGDKRIVTPLRMEWRRHFLPPHPTWVFTITFELRAAEPLPNPDVPRAEAPLLLPMPLPPPASTSATTYAQVCMLPDGHEVTFTSHPMSAAELARLGVGEDTPAPKNASPASVPAIPRQPALPPRLR